MIVSVSRHAHFNAAHRLFNKEWSNEQNDEIFGKCNNPHYHGHNYELIVTVKGPIDPKTGYVMDMKVLADLIEDKVEKQLDHKNLNEEVPIFKTRIPTVEWIAVTIWEWLRPHISEDLDLKVVLYETPRNFCEFDGTTQR
ncbi:6-carboxytetrahydropterin synthase [Phaeocystidibacter marisrubri]|uniref:6-carboxy-5,6,7,8-tetrahydropterin synthase n=1 Tax=Phaeocystidibacter marisrubri TaxID=1577780 RepID=A0A6L3ZJF0_9FLAO|nr:6-carboxytetrahydropterin synthase [Phaeocystidibacter marisrubri]KAB2817749.1 6-carboxytetrahydropterin synthase [Phaeocystidibacter marisrubri]GGH73769.1 6-carboxy-5,6,7,8-tetrahydropterin synthase [Phaeocystidibacter marisrubri]